MVDERATSSDDGERAYRWKLTANDVNRRNVLKSGGALAGGLGLAGCLGGGGEGTAGDGGANESDGGGGGGGDSINVAIISSPAGFGDQAFNDLALEGLKNAKEEFGNIKIQQVEETNQSNYKTVQSRLAESQSPDYDLVVMVGYQHTQALQTNASQFSDQRWMLINANVEQPNVAGFSWANHQMSWQAGVLGATMTTKEFSYEDSSTTADQPVIGFVGGVDGALINAFERGYTQGAKWLNEDVEVRVGYIGNYTDTQTANNIASSQFDAGADIVYHAAAAAGQGVFQAAQEAGRFAIGVDADQSTTLSEYQDVIMGSAVKYINRGTYQAVKAISNDNWEEISGQNILGLEEEAVEVVLGQSIGPNLPSVVGENLEESRQAIINGDVTVPCSATGCQD